MYRRHLQTKMSEEQLVTRVTSLPVVHSTMDQVTIMYSKTKDYNRLTRLTFQLVESGAVMACGTAKPMAGYFEPQLQAVNLYGVKKLEELEEAYPIITKPTEEVIEETKAYVEKTLKPTVDRVKAPIQYGVDTYQSMKKYGVEKVQAVKTGVTDKIDGVTTTVKDLGRNTVAEVVESKYGQLAKNKVDDILTSAEDLVDHFLPEDTPAGEQKPVAGELVPTNQSNPLVRVGNLGNKVRRRTYARAMKELGHLQKRSKETLEKLDFTVDLIKYAKDNFETTQSNAKEKWDAAKTKAADVWDEINQEETEQEKAGEETPISEQSLERRSIFVARRLTLRLKHGLNAMSSIPERVLPIQLKTRMQEMKIYAEEWFKAFTEVNSVKDIPNLLLLQVKDQIERMQETLMSLTESVMNSRALSWMGKQTKCENAEEIEMETITPGNRGDDSVLDDFDDDEDDSRDQSTMDDSQLEQECY